MAEGPDRFSYSRMVSRLAFLDRRELQRLQGDQRRALERGMLLRKQAQECEDAAEAAKLMTESFDAAEAVKVASAAIHRLESVAMVRQVCNSDPSIAAEVLAAFPTSARTASTAQEAAPSATEAAL